MPRPLVSILTPTIPERHDLLVETLHNIRAQTYPAIEHIVVVEDPDPRVSKRIQREVEACERQIPTSVWNTGRRWTTYLKNSRNAAPIIVAQLMAHGEYLMFLADDERMDEHHIEALVAALEVHGADFAYSKTRMWHISAPARSWIIGTDPPQCGQITNALFRARLVEMALTQLNHGECPDWLQFEAWMRAGATWAFVPQVTLTHRADQ